MTTDRRLFALVATLLLACGGGEEPAAAPQLDADGLPVAPGAAPAAAPAAPAPAAPRPIQLADVDTVILREVFSYSGGTRDPFVSLLGSGRSGPMIGDLSLVAISFNASSPSQSVAVVREKVSGRRHSLRIGQRLGQLYVTDMNSTDVWFTIDDFGVQRRESLTLRKQEDDIP